MLELEAQAQAIITQLETVDAIGTVAFVEDDDESMRHPVTLPAVFVGLDTAEMGGKGQGTTVGGVVWFVIVRAKSLKGTDGCLSIVDATIDSLTGFKPSSTSKPLKGVRVDYFGKRAESAAYIIRFGNVAAGGSTNALCGD